MAMLIMSLWQYKEINAEGINEELNNKLAEYKEK